MAHADADDAYQYVLGPELGQLNRLEGEQSVMAAQYRRFSVQVGPSG